MICNYRRRPDVATAIWLCPYLFDRFWETRQKHNPTRSKFFALSPFKIDSSTNLESVPFPVSSDAFGVGSIRYWMSSSAEPNDTESWFRRSFRADDVSVSAQHVCESIGRSCIRNDCALGRPYLSILLIESITNNYNLRKDWLCTVRYCAVSCEPIYTDNHCQLRHQNYL